MERASLGRRNKLGFHPLRPEASQTSIFQFNKIINHTLLFCYKFFFLNSTFIYLFIYSFMVQRSFSLLDLPLVLVWMRFIPTLSCRCGHVPKAWLTSPSGMSPKPGQ